MKDGYIRDRNDGMTEYTIVGLEPVIKILKLLAPYIRLKEKHIILAKQIYLLIGRRFNLKKFIQAAEMVDKFAELNYSKKRANFSKNLKDYLRQHKLYPRND